MKQFKIYGEAYELSEPSGDVVDSYAIKGELVDEEPKGKYIGEVTMDDGSVVACYKPKNVLPLLLLIVLLIFGVGALVYFLILPMFEKDVAIGGTMLSTEVSNNIVIFNGIMEASDGTVDVRFMNGDVPATIKVEGDGVVSQTYTVEPNASLDTIPVEITTDKSVVEVVFTVTSNGTESTFNALVEIPDNQTMYDPETTLNSYFEREKIIDEYAE